MTVLLAVLLASMNQTIVSTAGPAIQQALNIENSLYSWITTAYLLASTALVPIYGKLSDLVGRKLIMIFGVLVFVAGSVLCGLADGVGMLIAGRGVQGLGGAALLGLMFAVIADLYPPEQRSRYTALVGGVFSLATVLGSIVGGYVTDHFGWHNVFFISIPLGVLTLGTMLFMPPLKQQRERAPLDFVGAGLLVLFSVTLLLALSLGKTQVSPGESGFLWGSWQILSFLATAVTSLIAFIAVELRAADPIIDIRLFRNQTYAVANGATFLLGIVFFAATVFLPLFMVNVIGLSATNAGLTTFPLTIGLVISSIVAGQAYARIGIFRPVIFVGGLFLMLGFVLMGYTLRPDSTQFELTWKMIVIGLGLGPILPMLTLAIQGAVKPSEIGAATGTNSFLRSLGSTLGVALLGTLFASTLKTEIQDKVDSAKGHLPAEMRAQFDVQGTSGKKTGGSTQSFDAAQLKREAIEKLDKSRNQYIAALRDHDQGAIQALLNDPKTAPQLRDVLKKGGFEGVIRAGFDEQRQLLTRAVLKHDPAAIQTITSNPQTPQELKEVVRGGVTTQVEATIAHQRDLLTRALLWNDPAAVRDLLANPQTPAELRQVLARGGVEAQVKARFDEQRTLLTRALIENDPAATAQLLADPQAPAELKGLLQNGGVRAQVSAAFAQQRALLTAAIVGNDPAATAQLLANPQTPAELKGLFQDGGLEARVEAGLTQQRTLLTRALRDNDPQAVQILLAASTTPVALKQTLASGGLRAAVTRGVDTQKAAIAAAVNAGDLSPLLKNPALPQPLRRALAAIPAAALATSEARTATRKQVEAQLDAARPAAETAAINAALSTANTRLDAALPGALTSARQQALQQVLTGLAAKEKEALASVPRQALDEVLAGLVAQEPAVLASAPPQALHAALVKLDAAEQSALKTAPQQALKKILLSLNAKEQEALAITPKKSLTKIVSGIDETKAKVLPVIDGIGAGIKLAFTDAVSLLYRVGFGVAALALIVSMFLKEARPGSVTREQIVEDELRSIEV
ncbi:hypothetical protein GCM10008949_49300 [Deinococcus humi]|nr:hypothetical protein GCM10008949_49300 [Deinococcus humi]